MRVLEESMKIKTNFEFPNLSKTGENALKISYSHASSKQREREREKYLESQPI